MHHAERSGGSVAAAQNWATHGPLTLASNPGHPNTRRARFRRSTRSRMRATHGSRGLKSGPASPSRRSSSASRRRASRRS